GVPEDPLEDGGRGGGGGPAGGGHGRRRPGGGPRRQRPPGGDRDQGRHAGHRLDGGQHDPLTFPSLICRIFKRAPWGALSICRRPWHPKTVVTAIPPTWCPA